VPQVLQVEAEGDTKTESTVATMADCVRPLLFSMKMFGLYFKRESETGVESAGEKSGRHWNGYMIYGLVMTIVMWINMMRMFSAFKNVLFDYLVFRCNRYFLKPLWFRLLYFFLNLC